MTRTDFKGASVVVKITGFGGELVKLEIKFSRCVRVWDESVNVKG